MLLPIRWLKDYIDTQKSGKELADGLTLSGSHVESIYSMNKGVKGVIVGKIIEIEKHPDADKLVICKIDIGREVLDIVTGATNVREGQFVPVATVGTILPGEIIIQKTNFRGVDSFGMLCSLKELGFNENVISKPMKDGIFILDKEYPLGTDIVDVLNLNDEVIEFEITPNRPDCLSILGMARETAASFELPLKEPEISFETMDNISDYIKDIDIESKNCNRYYARVVKDVVIKDSPMWIQLRLMEAGIRPINNIVDITNFVMLEFGEPLHAFDLEKISGEKIIVRQAKTDEAFISLDGESRKLNETDLVIADDKEPIAIAGVMGGLHSEVTKDTKLILIEGANFDQRSVRLTSKRLSLRTEASNRFEKGLDPNLCQIAADRVCQLIELTKSGKIVDSFIDKYKEKKEEKTISLRPERANMLLGLDINEDIMIKYLNLLGLKSVYKEGLIYTTVPTRRIDIDIEADLIEEIGRLYGFHNIESKSLIGELTRGVKPFSKTIEDEVKKTLLGIGFNEVMTYSFISPKVYDKTNIDKKSHLRDYIKILNPLGEDYSVMRTTLVPTMMDLFSRNYNKSVKSAFAFEIGNIFLPKELPIVNLPIEQKVLSIGFYGEKDFYFLKETVEKLLCKLGIKDIEYKREEENPVFHPGRTAKAFVNGIEIGTMGEVYIDVCENYDINSKVYIAELDFEKIMELCNFERKYKSLPKYPSTSRDIAVIVDEEILVGDIKSLIIKHSKGIIEDIELFDIYRGDQIPENMKSMAFSITYRSYERTLKDKEVEEIQTSIIRDLEKTFDAKLRS
ncbi:phenylalanine--tRNA ligase subunit beta [Tissierella creatinophila]|uniref:Phenylalanine--tRNA ligase beta subunit n=1 Tax=Tissierella creatinophila DSM 6911 TaxID=1123403 RepID=A0A1U7M6J1_TISCR|nr:phenylalanine--tRNA ligase subunit beta [Tissierella creatinophila]OLS02829.1 phenylalanine--tRNA ligase beta subunit [Tissierella creatinophila DSM 6911]